MYTDSELANISTKEFNPGRCALYGRSGDVQKPGISNIRTRVPAYSIRKYNHLHLVVNKASLYCQLYESVEVVC